MLRILFRMKLEYELNLENPCMYNEKLQWIELHDRNPLMPKCCDKYMAREYVESKGSGSILNRLIWWGFDPVSIPFDDLSRNSTEGTGFGKIEPLSFDVKMGDLLKLPVGGSRIG